MFACAAGVALGACWPPHQPHRAAPALKRSLPYSSSSEHTAKERERKKERDGGRFHPFACLRFWRTQTKRRITGDRLLEQTKVVLATPLGEGGRPRRTARSNSSLCSRTHRSRLSKKAPLERQLYHCACFLCRPECWNDEPDTFCSGEVTAHARAREQRDPHMTCDSAPGVWAEFVSPLSSRTSAIFSVGHGM